MGDSIIKAENIGKCYRIGMKNEIQDTFGRTIIDFIKTPVKNYRKYRSLYKFDEVNPGSSSNFTFTSSDILWALQGISFEVKEGEMLGIIGLNGSGKSTLLKILSKITSPTRGRVEIRGRISSLLEVGTGFNPELTGRDNVYLNGSILGMRKREIDRKFDAIVDFSEVEDFIDTPVKRYSSGMAVRLAFAVAAHLEPEILLIDEVLAVGDTRFQKKCLSKMGEVTKEGRTILFVSHNVGTITEYCSRTLLLDKGRLKLDGPSADVVAQYMAPFEKGAGHWVGSEPEEGSGRLAWLTHVRMFSGSNRDEVSTLFHYDEQINIEIGYNIKRCVRGFRSYLLLLDYLGNIIWASHDTDGTDLPGKVREPGTYNSTCVFPQHLLRPGQYHVTIGIYGDPPRAYEAEYQSMLSFEVSNVNYPFNRTPRQGIVTPYLGWKVVREEKMTRSSMQA